eukprot:TRINITY_DN186_c3_g3_i1.p1 TRINITY_DN186_c3_g3~~TRINITY_DN186_c3_g3_i1.p1  ORF type:complete len:463 (-),score=148.43 TRINITY_DN186_c3_g3_i1:39-1427(-)
MSKPFVRRYRPGKVPDYVKAEDAEKFLHDVKTGSSSTFGAFGKKVAPKADNRLARLQNATADPEEGAGESRAQRHRRIIEAAEIVEEENVEETVRERRRRVPDAEIVDDVEEEPTTTIVPEGETPAERRARLQARAKAAETEVDEGEALGELSVGEDDSGEDSEEDSSYESDDSSDNEWDIGGRTVIRPTFVRKAQRQLVTEAEAEEEKEKERLERKEAEAKSRKERTKQLLQDQISRDKEALDEKENETVYDSDGEAVEEADEDDPIYKQTEYEKWKFRELLRIKRDRAEREEYKNVRADAARRRAMTDDEVMAERRANGEDEKEKTNMKFMQKYYHKGAFYQEELGSLEKKADEWTAPTGWDREVDMAAMPKVLQVKNFGLAGRTKYTHLVDQDTSTKDDPWAKAHSAGFKGRPQGNAMYGGAYGPDGSVQAGAAIIAKNKKRLGGFGDFERPSKKRRQQ